MSIPPISAHVQSDFERSCNMRCCFCFFVRRGTPKVTNQTQTTPPIASVVRDLAISRLQEIEEKRKLES